MQAYGRLKHSIAPTRQGRALWMATKKAATWAQQRTDPLRPWLLHQLHLRELALLVRAEQAPNPLSRGAGALAQRSPDQRPPAWRLSS